MQGFKYKEICQNVGVGAIDWLLCTLHVKLFSSLKDYMELLYEMVISKRDADVQVENKHLIIPALGLPNVQTHRTSSKILLLATNESHSSQTHC